MKRNLLAAALSGLILGGLAAVSAAQTVDFSNLTHPIAGVGSSNPAYTQNGFSLLRIADPADPATNVNHFHTVAGSHGKTSADFFSDDGSPFRYFLGPILGSDASNYQTGPQTPFNLKTFTVFRINTQFTLTSSLGVKQVIDQPGVYTFGAGFAGITEFQHSFTGDFDGDMIVDALTFKPTTYRSVSGVISLDGEPAATLRPVHIELRAPGDTAPLFTFDLPTSGAFTLPHLPDSVYDIAFRGANTLRRTLTGVDLTGGNQSGLTVLLEGGDANGDNSCDSTDFTALIGSFNSDATIAGSGYDPTADFNNDGFVDSSDFTILIGSFNQQGDR